MTRSNLDAVLEAVKFPARVADLDAGLPDVDGDALPHLPPLLSDNRSSIGGGREGEWSRIDRGRTEWGMVEDRSIESGSAGVCEDAEVNDKCRPAPRRLL